MQQQADILFASTISFWGLQLFFIVLIFRIARSTPSLFVDRHGWSHRLTGSIHLLLLLTGAFSSAWQPQLRYYSLLYDIYLGCSGMLLAYTAARDFPLRTIRNAPGQSGTLSEKAIVTQAEMIEHLFYQFLNLWQA